MADSSCNSDTGTESPNIQNSRSSSRAPSLIQEQIQQPSTMAARQGNSAPKPLAPRPVQVPIQVQYSAGHLQQQPQYRVQQAIYHYNQPNPAANLIPANFARVPQQMPRNYGHQPVLNAMPNGHDSREENGEEEQLENDMPLLHEQDDHQLYPEDVDADEEDDTDDSLQRMFLLEASNWHSRRLRILPHSIDDVVIHESASPFSQHERRQPEVHLHPAEETSYEEEPVKRKRGGPGSRGGRGRGGRGRGRGGRGGRNRRIVREVEELQDQEDIEVEDQVEQIQEPAQEPAEEQMQAAQADEQPVEEREAAAAPVGKKHKRKRNQVEMLGEGFEGQAFGTPAKCGRRRSTIEARPKEVRKSPMTRRKRKEQSGELDYEAPAKTPPPATPESSNEDSPASDGKPDPCLQCGQTVPKDSQHPQYCTTICRRNYHTSRKEPEEQIRQEEPAEEEIPLAADYYNDETIPIDDQMPQDEEVEEEAEREDMEDVAFASAPPAEAVVSAPTLRAAIEQTPSPPALDLQPDQQEDPMEDAMEEEEPQEEEPEEEEQQPQAAIPNHDNMALKYWNVEYTAAQVSVLMKKEGRVDIGKVFLEHQIDGYTIWTQSKNVVKTVVAFGPTLSIFTNFLAEDVLRKNPPYTADSPPAFNTSHLNMAESVKDWIAEITNQEVAEELFMCNLDAVAISNMTPQELMECTSSLKLGYAHKIHHILEENKRKGFILTPQFGEDLPARMKNTLIDCLSLCMGNQLATELVNVRGIDSDVIYHLTMEDLVKNLDLKYGIAKRVSLLIEQARLEGGDSSPEMVVYRGPPSQPTVPIQVSGIFQHVLSTVEKEHFKKAMIRGDMLQYLTTDDLVKIGLRFGTAKKVVILCKLFKDTYGWSYDTLMPADDEFLRGASSFSEQQMFQWISSICSLEVAVAFKEASIDGSLLSCLDAGLLVKFCKIRFDHAKTICVKLMNMKRPGDGQDMKKLTNEELYNEIAAATSPGVVEVLKKSGLNIDNIAVVGLENLLDDLKLKLVTALKIINCLKTVEMPHVIKPVDGGFSRWNVDQVSDWAIGIGGPVIAERLKVEQMDGHYLAFLTLNDLTSELEFPFGPSKVIHDNVLFWRRV